MLGRVQYLSLPTSVRTGMYPGTCPGTLPRVHRPAGHQLALVPHEHAAVDGSMLSRHETSFQSISRVRLSLTASSRRCGWLPWRPYGHQVGIQTPNQG